MYTDSFFLGPRTSDFRPQTQFPIGILTYIRHKNVRFIILFTISWALARPTNAQKTRDAVGRRTAERRRRQTWWNDDRREEEEEEEEKKKMKSVSQDA